MKDTMTPRQRWKALSEGKKVDRYPIHLFHGTVASRLINMTYRESESTSQNIAQKEIACYKEYGCDNISVNYGLFSMGRALGSKMKESEDASSGIAEYLLSDISDWEKLDFSKSRLDQDPELEKVCQAAILIDQEIGDEVDIAFEITGPLTAASSLIETEDLLRATRKNKDAVHGLLRATTDALIKIIEDFSSLDNIIFNITDPVASGSLISPKQYQEFSLPYTRDLVTAMKKRASPVTIHICGDTRRNLPYIAQTGVDWISLDQKVPLQEAKEIIGDEIGLIGNVEPVKYFLQGSPQEMEEAVRECFIAGYNSPKGFIIGPGCSVPLNTPLDNIDSYMSSARHYSQYPYDDSLFS